MLLHVSRGVRWDSDHVVTLTDELHGHRRRSWCAATSLSRVHIGLDYFDASINRVAAWVIGARNMLKALLLALLEPIDQLQADRDRRRFHLPAGPAGRDSRACRSARCGTITACSRACPSGSAFMEHHPGL